MKSMTVKLLIRNLVIMYFIEIIDFYKINNLNYKELIK